MPHRGARTAVLALLGLSCTVASPARASRPLPPRTPAPAASSADLPGHPRRWHEAPQGACVTRVVVADRESQWVPPLDRVVSVSVEAAALPAVLDRVAVAGGIALSYSPDFLRARGAPCVRVERVPLGALLATLLAGTPLRAVSVGATLVVLAPAGAAPAAAPMARRTSVLDRVVVTGTPDGAAQRGSPWNLEVLDGAMLAQQRTGSLLEALDAHVPGIWAWSASSGGVVARYGSVRGASSFGATTPKVYLDGIEVANPLLVTLIDPARIDRVEVIRGPQGAALYGADAISGVVHILTRHDGAAGGRDLSITSSAGLAATDFAPRRAVAQEHGLAARVGDASRNVGGGASLATLGAYAPGAGERRLLADASLRWLAGRRIVTATARLGTQRANAVASPLLAGVTDAVAGARPTGLDTVAAQATTQYTVGATLAFMPTARWTHTVVAGVDGYRLAGVSSVALPVPSIVDSALRDAQGAGDRLSARWRSTGRYDAGDGVQATLLLGAEQSLLRTSADAEALYRGAPAQVAVRGAPQQALWSSNSGVLGQAGVAHRERLFGTAGVRLERTEGVQGDAQWSVLPSLGVAAVGEVGRVTLKGRVAYGRGIRPSQHVVRGVTAMGRAVSGAALALAPEGQDGVEVGADLLVGTAFTVRVTRFDQHASGLIQPVAVPLARLGAGAADRRVAYVLQNVGAIDNHGWELEARTRAGRWSVGGTYALVASRVAQTARAYTGDLRAGDRMLEVPRHTASALLGWDAGRWGISGTVTHAADWVAYDRIAIATALGAGAVQPRDLTGPALRGYWRTYDGVTRVRAQLRWAWRPAWTLLAGGDNLLDVQRGTPDNTTVMAGRTLTLGLRAGF